MLNTGASNGRREATLSPKMPVLMGHSDGRSWRQWTVCDGGREWATLLLLAVLWGGSFFFNGVAVRGLPFFTLVWLRVAVAAVTLLGVLRLLGQRMPTERRVWAAFGAMGLLNSVVPFVLIVWGRHHIASSLAPILNATTPLFTVLNPPAPAYRIIGALGRLPCFGPDRQRDCLPLITLPAREAFEP